MKDLFSEVRWGRIVLVGIGAVILDIVLDLLVLFLATQVWSQPSQAQTANSVASWTTYILLLLFTLIAAIWIASKVEKETALNGALVGLVIGFMLFIVSRGFGSPFLTTLVTWALNIAVGYLGGAIVGRRRGTTELPTHQRS